MVIMDLTYYSIFWTKNPCEGKLKLISDFDEICINRPEAQNKPILNFKNQILEYHNKQHIELLGKKPILKH